MIEVELVWCSVLWRGRGEVRKALHGHVTNYAAQGNCHAAGRGHGFHGFASKSTQRCIAKFVQHRHRCAGLVEPPAWEFSLSFEASKHIDGVIRLGVFFNFTQVRKRQRAMKQQCVYL
jgi:hypothetical protein